ncbi:MAG TPA: tRNA pseudouridine(55) synthase TruB [Thermomicrobiales bacterium]|nr:tRNA pseudouridine(55) synthase TruB [Thermomicrobiales bacterium]
MPHTDRFHGLLIIDKPAGWTSHDVVGRIRRLLGQRSVGHAGTLDPAATGVLPVAVGSGLRALEYLTGETKSYRAEITFGLTTDALDSEGHVTGFCDPPTLDELQWDAVLQTFRGPYEQVPPVFSAIKIDGTPLYERARRGETIEPPKRSVAVYSLVIQRWEPPVLTVDIDCSKGFYVRSFARDLGVRAGSCGYLSNLVRTRVGAFDLCDAWRLDELSEAPLAAEWERIALAPDTTALGLPAIILPVERVIDWEHGKRWPIDDARGSGSVRVYDCAGVWLGIGELAEDGDATTLRPRKVIPTLTTHVQEQD